MQGHKRKDLRCIENVIEGHKVMIGMLEADVAGAVIDCLNAAIIK
jgi:hypothetical protein